MKNKKLKVKKSNNFYWFIILGIFLIIIAIFIAPFWAKINDGKIPWSNWGMTLFLFLLSFTLFTYVFKVLVYKLKVKKQHKIVKILTACEFSIMILVAVLCILFGLDKVEILDFDMPAKLNDHIGTVIVGFAIWIRGFVEIFGAYYYDKNDSNLKPYPVWYLLINIGLISIGPMFIFNKDITDSALLYVYSALILVSGVFSMVYGFLAKPVIIEEPAENEEPKNKKSKKERKETKPQIEEIKPQIEETQPQIENVKPQIENEKPQIELKDNNDNNDDIVVE